MKFDLKSFICPLLCQITTYWPKKRCSKVLWPKPSHFWLVCMCGEFLCQSLAVNFFRCIDGKQWKLYLPSFVSKNHILTQKEMFSGQNQVIFGCFAYVVSLYAKSNEILAVIFFRRIGGKQQKNDQKWCGEGLDAKPSPLGLVSNFGIFCVKSHEILTVTFLSRIDRKR